MEAGGVEPPSEKRYGSKPTCLAQFRFVLQAALRMSKKRSPLVRLVLAVLPRTETQRPAYSVTFLTGPVGEARGNVADLV